MSTVKVDTEPTKNELAKFDEVRAALVELKTKNENLVFDYEDAQGNKDARSHIYKLRQAKTKIAEIHKVAKAEALGICRMLDGEKNKLTIEVDEMIDVHYKPVKEIEERVAKAAAVKANAERLEAIRIEAERAEAVEKREEELAAKEAAVKAKEEELAKEAERLEAAKQAEIDKQAALKEAREQAERDKAEAAAQVEQDKKDAAERAEADKQAAVDAEKERVRKEVEAAQGEKDRLAEIEADRVADKTHRSNVNAKVETAIRDIMGEACKGTDCNVAQIASLLLDAIVIGAIPHVTINY